MRARVLRIVFLNELINPRCDLVLTRQPQRLGKMVEISCGIDIAAFVLADGRRITVKDGWNGILNEQLDSRNRPCNFVELMPRLKEV